MQKSSSHSYRKAGPGSKNTFKKDGDKEWKNKEAKPFKKSYDGRGAASGNTDRNSRQSSPFNTDSKPFKKNYDGRGGDASGGTDKSRGPAPYNKDSKPYKKNYDGRGPSSGASPGGGSRSARPYSGRVTDSDSRKHSPEGRPGSFGKPSFGKDSRPERSGEGTDRKPRKEFSKPFNERPKYKPSDRDGKPADRRGSFDKPAFNKRDNKEEGSRKPYKEFDKPRDAGKDSRPFGEHPKHAPADRRGSFDKPAFNKRDNKEEGSRKPRKEFDKPRSAGKDSRPFRDRPTPRPGDKDKPGFNKKDGDKAQKPESEPRTFSNVMDDAFKQPKSKKKESTVDDELRKPRQFEDEVFGELGEDEKENIPKPYAKSKVNKAFTKKKHFHDHSEGRKKNQDDDEDTDDDDKEINQKDGPRLEMPLNKYIAHSGECSRREAAELVRQGKVKVNGELILEPGYRVKHDDKVTMSGKKLTPQKGMVYILLNKPKGFITTNDDPQGRRTVMELVGNSGIDRLFPVGRLDRNTSGLLLITNDGDLTQKLSHPAYEIKKVYQVTLDRPLTKADFDKIVEGVELEDGIAKVDALAYLEKKDELGLEIHSGRNRIVRRIFESLTYEVVKLDRVMYAGLTKKNLPRSKWRYLDEREVVLLKHFKS